MGYIEMIQCQDGECPTWLTMYGLTITKNLEVGYYKATEKLPLMDYIESKYWSKSLELLSNFDSAVRKDHRKEIEAILQGFSNGSIW